MGRGPNIENIRIFQDTMEQCSMNTVLQEVILRSCKGQKVILESDEYPSARPGYDHPCKVVVSAKRSFEAASAYEGKRVCVLNFASSSNPGGGVVQGSSAQEESLCRCSTLYPCLNLPVNMDLFYNPHRRNRNPLHTDDCIYTPGVVVFKEDTSRPKALDPKDWRKVNVITCAAPNLRMHPSNTMNPGDGDNMAIIGAEELRALHEKRMRRILDVAAGEGNEVVILGAFGCGAFRNDPEVVARALAKVVQEYRHMFETIEFAVYCRSFEDVNYRAFAEYIGELEYGEGNT